MKQQSVPHRCQLLENDHSGLVCDKADFCRLFPCPFPSPLHPPTPHPQTSWHFVLKYLQSAPETTRRDKSTKSSNHDDTVLWYPPRVVRYADHGQTGEAGQTPGWTAACEEACQLSRSKDLVILTTKAYTDITKHLFKTGSSRRKRCRVPLGWEGKEGCKEGGVGGFNQSTSVGWPEVFRELLIQDRKNGPRKDDLLVFSVFSMHSHSAIIMLASYG